MVLDDPCWRVCETPEGHDPQAENRTMKAIQGRKKSADFKTENQT